MKFIPMQRILMTSLMFVISLPVFAETISGRGTVVCGLFQVHECVADGPCEQVRPEEVNLRTRFLTVDFENKTLATRDGRRSTRVERIHEVGNKWVLAGAESGEYAGEDGLAFSVTINRETGQMGMSATGDDVSFMIFGACTAP